jgi:nucleoside-diphosphate kinase
MQQTLVLLKPDALARGLAGAILARFEAALLRVADARLVRPTLDQLEIHYASLRRRDQRAFRRTTQSLAGQPFLAVVLVGPHAIQKVRALTGPTDPLSAPPGTIRGDLGNDTIASADAADRSTWNLIHAADAEAAVAHEIALWFGEPAGAPGPGRTAPAKGIAPPGGK